MTKDIPSFHFLLYLALLSIIGFLAIDMYLPAFDLMHQDLGTTKSAIGMSLTLYFAGFALGQIFWGPISEGLGKGKAITLGMLLFTLASIGIFLTQSVALLWGLRVLQAFGACAAAVCWQALVVERYLENERQKVFASIMPLVALSPALAPLLGVYVLEHSSWRYIFLILAIPAAFLVLYSLLFVKNEAPKEAQDAKEKKSYLSFFSSKPYIGNVLVFSFCSAGFFAWVTGAPFFLKDLGYDEKAIGWSFVPQTIAFIIGGYGYRFLAGKVDGKKLLPYLLGIYALSMLSILGLAVLTVPTLTALLIPFCFMAFANGATYPIVVNLALGRFPEHTGKASALQNTLQQSACFLASAVVSAFSEHALLISGIVMGATVVLVFGAYALSKASEPKGQAVLEA